MAPKKNYSDEQMKKAIDSVNNGEKIAYAAQKYGVPRITLYNKITGKSPLVCSMGPSTYLTKEEEHILETWILQMKDSHIPVTKDDLLDSVQRIITEKNIETPFIHNRPGKKWYNLFLKRHPLISERTAQNLTAARDNVTEEDIIKWFSEIESYLREKNLLTVLEHPERVFNTDESAFYLNPKAGKVLARKGEKHVYSSSGDDKENLTVLVTGNAAGQLAPTMVVYSYERVPSAIAANFPTDWAIGLSNSGWMCGSTFYEYIANFFNPWLDENSIERPVLFFLDGHKSHLTLHLSDFCVANGIEIIALNPNSTHIMQPMDLAVFRPLKASWRKAVTKWKYQNLGQTFKKEHFAPVLEGALKSLSCDSIKNGFRAGGLCPFGPDYIDMTKIKRSQRQETEDDIAKKDFFSYLESEISTVFTPQKLHEFRQHYFTGRDNLEVPEQDLSLYIIWAKNFDAKSSEVTTHSEDTTGTSEDNSHVTGPITLNQLKTTAPNDNNFKATSREDSNPGLSRDLLNVTAGPSTQTEKISRMDLEPSTSKSNLDVIAVCPVTSKKTPKKTVIKGGLIIPSPFKRNLFWPGENESNKKKRKLKEKIPCAIGSTAWRTYYQNKENEKKLKLLEKERRAEARQEKKRKMEELKRKRTHIKKSKKQINLPISSDDTDTEVKYAESDESILSEGLDDVPLSTLVPSPQELSKGSYVIVLYEGQHFPGIIENSNENEFEVSTMTFSTGNTYKWPEKEDKMWYRRKDIVEYIRPPILINKRGFYSVKEMQKYSNFTF